MPAVSTTCPYCGVGCGVIAREEDRGWTVSGDPDHPANRGLLCSKGMALAETIGLEGRLLTPQVRTSEGTMRRVSWDDALDAVAARFRETVARHGPEAVALYVSGQLLTEDYYVANKFVKGWLGTAQIDTNSRLCMASAVAGHKRAFGEDIVPVSYDDLDRADLFVLVGSNAAWCHPVLFGRIRRACATRAARLVVIDPRRSATAEEADLHVPIAPGQDGLLFAGLLAELARRGAVVGDSARADWVAALAEATAAAGDRSDLARRLQVEESVLDAFFSLFVSTERVVTLFSQGINQSTSGTDKVNAIINCHVATGRIGRPGAGPFSVTGQPNAMGGREVGGLSNALAAHLDIENPLHRQLVQEFWGSPAIASHPGLKAVELFEAIGRGQVQAVWILGTNPLVSLPDAAAAAKALAACPFVVVSDCVTDTDTAACAHVLLPAAAWGEKDGTVTNSERCISRQRPFLPLPGAARPDWWALAQVARRLFPTTAFDYESPGQIFVEHARLSAYRNGSATGDIPRFFNLAGLADLSPSAYDALAPVRWPVIPGVGPAALPDRPLRLIPIRPRGMARLPDASYPFILNTGRLRDQWHTMTRTGRAPSLAAQSAAPELSIHPLDALKAGVRAGALARVLSIQGQVVLRVKTDAAQLQGTVFAPIHFSDATASDARVGTLIAALVDPLSGEPEFKHTPVAVEPFAVEYYGFALARTPIATDSMTWWARSPGAGHEHVEFALRSCPDLDALRALIPGAGEWIEYEDLQSGDLRLGRLCRGQLEACAFVSRRTELPRRDWVGSLFTGMPLSPAERFGLLAGRLAVQVEGGALVCACMGVRAGTIEAAIAQGASSPSAVSAATRAGTNCGSCLSEIRRLLEAALAQ